MFFNVNIYIPAVIFLAEWVAQLFPSLALYIL